jgi:hypothetical protein
MKFGERLSSLARVNLALALLAPAGSTLADEAYRF